MSELPFDIAQFLQPEGESLKLGELIEIPRYGSPTVEEAIALAVYYEAHETVQQNILDLRVDMATLLLQSRFRPDWQREHTTKLPIHWIEEAAEFFWGEQRRWKPLTEASEEARPRRKKPLTGVQHSGESSDSTPTTQDLAA